MSSLKAAWVAAKKNTNFTEHIKMFHRFELEEIYAKKSLGITHVQIRAFGSGGRTCKACLSVSGEINKIENEMSNPTLPVPNCTCTAYDDTQTNFCLCNYDPVFDDELP